MPDLLPSLYTRILVRRFADAVVLVGGVVAILAGLIILTGTMGRQVRSPPLQVLRLACDTTLALAPWLATPLLAIATILAVHRSQREGHLRRLATLGLPPWRLHLPMVGCSLLLGLATWLLAAHTAPRLLQRAQDTARSIHRDPDLLAAALHEHPQALGWGTLRLLDEPDETGLRSVLLFTQEHGETRLLHAERVAMPAAGEATLQAVRLVTIDQAAGPERARLGLSAQAQRLDLRLPVPSLRLLDDAALASLEHRVLAALQSGYPVGPDELQRLHAAPALRLVRLQLLVLPACAVLGLILALTAVPARRLAHLYAVVPAIILLPAGHIAVEQAVVSGSITSWWMACLPLATAVVWLGVLGCRR